jgi:hypothetical protein
VVSSFGTRIGTVGTLSRALGPAKENIYALESLKGDIVWGCWGLKRKSQFKYATIGMSTAIPASAV